MKNFFKRKKILVYISFFFLSISFFLFGGIISNSIALGGKSFSLWAIFSFIFSIFNLLLLIGILFLIVKYIVKIYFEKSGKKWVSLKTRLTLTFFLVSLIPTVIFIFFSYQIVSKNFNMFFTTPVAEILNYSMEVEKNFFKEKIAEVRNLQKRINTSGDISKLKEDKINYVIIGKSGKILKSYPKNFRPEKWLIKFFIRKNVPGTKPFIISSPEKDYIVAAKKIDGNILIITKTIPGNLSYDTYRIKKAYQKFKEFRNKIRLIKSNYYMGIIAIGFLLFFGFGWFGYFLSKKFSEPLMELSEAAKRIGKGDFSKKVQIKTKDEFSLVARSFNKMIDEIKKSRDKLIEKNEELKRRSQFIETTVNTIDTGFLFINNNFEIKIINKKGRKLLNLEYKKSDNVYLKKAISIKEKQNLPIFKALMDLIKICQREKQVSRELQIRKNNAEIVLSFRVSGIEISPEQSGGFVVIFDDVTESIRAEKAIAWQNVAKRLAHEIKNPLTPVQLGAERIEKKFQKILSEKIIFNRDELLELGKVIEESVYDIKRESNLLKYMIDEFSKFAKLPSPRLKKTNIQKIISSRLKIFEKENKNIKFEFNYKNTLELFLDPILFDRLLTNIITNGIEALKNKDGEKKIFIDIIESKNSIFIDIGNNGPTIDKETAGNIFMPNFSTKKGGMGIGLTISKKIAEDHGFNLLLHKNNPNDGVIFRIEIKKDNEKQI